MQVNAFTLYVLKMRMVLLVWFLFDLFVGSGEWHSSTDAYDPAVHIAEHQHSSFYFIYLVLVYTVLKF